MSPLAWVTAGPKQPLRLEALELGPIGAEEVEVAVEHCGLCHSDLSVWHNAWGASTYPAILGHEAVGRVVGLGSNAKGLELGQRVGVGWMSGSCMHCRQCMGGRHQLCPERQQTIVGHRGGFATHLRSHWAWTLPLPDNLDSAEAGPLLCGGATVFAPIMEFAKPTDRVGVLGIGGLGHLAVKFASAFGCEVTALTSSPDKFEEARRFGASRVVATSDAAGLRKLDKSLDLLLSTINVKADWSTLIGALAPGGRLHLVGAVLEPIPLAAFSLISAQRSVSGSLFGSPAVLATMLDFAARQRIVPQNEHFPMSKINEAFSRLEAGKARYRIVLDADF